MTRHLRGWAFVVGVCACTLGQPGVAQQRQGVFSSRVESVRVDVLVSDGSRPVRGLTAADFTVVDNGVPQRVELISFDEVPVNVVPVLDVSGSLTGERLAQLRDACALLVTNLKQGDQAALVSFNDTVTLRSRLTADLARVQTAITRTEPAGVLRPTALIEALFTGMSVAESDVGRALVAVFSDGVDTGSWLGEDTVLDAATRTDAVVYAVATSHGGRSSFLRQATERTGGNLTEIESTSDLGPAFVAILDEFRQRYLVSYTPDGVSRPGWHDVVVRVKGRNLKVKARSGYWATQ